MGIELKITAESTIDLQQQIAALLAGVAIPVSAPRAEGTVVDETPPPAKRAPRKAKAEEQKAPEADEGNAGSSSEEREGPSSGTSSETTDSGASNQDNDEPTVTYGDVQKAVTQLAAKKGRDAVVGVFNKFGVDHGTKLKPEQWVDAVAELEQAAA